MCGIAGVAMAGGAPADGVLDALTASLAHRGPDGRGSHRRGGVGMVHTRLAIIDLKTGDQPIRDHGAALIANGEIYNDLEVRASLGVAYATGSDCETPLHLYRRHGLDFARHLRGMYAIAIDDPVNDRLVLARDPFGIKPLYTVARGLYFAFASEPQALLAAGLAPRSVHAAARDEMLQLQFSTGRATALATIERVLPGETVVVRDGRVVERRRIAALPEGPPLAMSEDEALERLDAALEDSVRCHQRADVPYGMFLSGGIDSSALLAMMARLNDRPVRAYTAAFPGAAVADERARARAVARALGAEHVEVEVGEDDFWRALPRIAAAVDDACADYAVVPSYLLAQAAAREVKVVLCGEGGDEMLAGYGRYRSLLRPHWLGGRQMRARGAFDGLDVLREPGVWRAGLAAAEAEAGGGGRSRLQAAQAIDCADWLPNDLLVKLDRCLMAHGLEGRTPYLDRVFAAAAFVLPDRLKVRGRLGKWALRRWLARHVPESAPLARKQGFTVPVAEWIAGQAPRLGPLVAAQPGIAELCRVGAVERLFASRSKRAGFAAWSLLYYALWHRAHILGVAPEGHVFEALAATAD